MKQFGIFLFVFSSILFTQNIFGQAEITVAPKDATTVTFSAEQFDYIEPIVGSPDPYYTFLWIFGDGTFIMNTRDSVIDHTFEAIDGKSYLSRGQSEVRVYATHNYGGGTRPPKKTESSTPPPMPTGYLFRPPSKGVESFINPNLRIDPSPAVIDTSVIDTTKTNYLRLQLNHDVKPEDTLVNIISFRNLHKRHIDRGQLYIFYNSKVTEKNRVPEAVERETTNGQPPISTLPVYSTFSHQEDMIHYDRVGRVNATGSTSALPGGIIVDDFQNFRVFNYDSLAPEGEEERHLFLEFENDSTLWELIDETVESDGDTVKFLAVMTALTFDFSLLDELNEIDSPYLDTAGIRQLLDTIFYTTNPSGGGTWQGVANSDLGSKIIGFSQVTSAIKKSHDPNNLNIYACECPDSATQKLICKIDFTNDGAFATTGIRVSMNIPDELEILSIDTLGHTTAGIPTHVFPIIDETTGEVVWDWFGALQPAQSFGDGHPVTKGEITFSILVKSGVDLNDIPAMKACIKFDTNAEMCTAEVKPENYITTIQNQDIEEKLQCKACEFVPDDGFLCCFGLPLWLCYLLYFIALILVLYILKFLSKLGQNS